MALMKEVYFIFDIQLPNPEVFCKLFKDNQICISVVERNILLPRTKSIAIKYYHLQIFVQKHLFGYVILIHKNKQRIFSLRHSRNVYSSVYKEKYLKVTYKTKPLLQQYRVLE